MSRFISDCKEVELRNAGISSVNRVSDSCGNEAREVQQLHCRAVLNFGAYCHAMGTIASSIQSHLSRFLIHHHSANATLMASS